MAETGPTEEADGSMKVMGLPSRGIFSGCAGSRL